VRGTYSSGVVWPDPRPDAGRVLVCFTFCGGGPAAYRLWSETRPADVDLALVCLPGRERRIREAAAQRWDELQAEAVLALRSVLGRPYVAFGHSMGALVAFEATVELQRRGDPLPQTLVVSASNAPSRAAAERRLPPFSASSDAELLAWMRRVGQLPEVVLGDPDLSQLALDLFRADRRASESYEFLAGTTVACPLRHLGGEQDPHVDPTDDAWSKVTTGGYQRVVLPGGHFYTDEVWRALPTYMGL
jgi:surfactin synthase thioesterase subunit